MKILIIAAHPDDETLGMGGTIARLKAEGHQVEVLFLGGGRGTTDDNAFDGRPLLTWVHKVETKLAQYPADVVYTHYEKDLNIDHRITYQAVITATRPIADQTVKEIYSFEVPSSTEWAYPLSFSPNVFVDISEYLVTKLKSLDKYSDEMRDYPHPRSIASIEHLARTRGIQVGLECVEAFKLVRIVR